MILAGVATCASIYCYARNMSAEPSIATGQADVRRSRPWVRCRRQNEKLFSPNADMQFHRSTSTALRSMLSVALWASLA